MVVTLEEVLQAAGREISRSTEGNVRSKGAVGDIVTDADLGSEAVIKQLLLDAFPHCVILAEESSSDISEESFAQHQFAFVVDPLDGTTNFRAKIPFYAVSIGSYSFGKASRGGILSLPDQSVYIASPGEGMKKNGQKVERPRSPELSKCVIGSAYAYGETPRPGMEALCRLVGNVATTRILGSAVLDMLYTALGVFDCYVHKGLCPWDSAAAAIFMREAGLVCKNWEGNDFSLFDETIVAAPPELFDEFWNLLSFNK